MAPSDERGWRNSPRPDGLIPVMKLRSFLTEATRAGIDVYELLHAAHVPSHWFAPGDRMMPIDGAMRIWKALAAIAPGDIGVRLGMRWHIHDFRLIGFASLGYPTYGEFSDRWMGRFDFIGIPLYFRSIVSEGSWRLEMAPWKGLPEEVMLMAFTEACASVHPIFQQLTGHEFQPARIETTAAQNSRTEASSIAIGTPISTDATRNSLVIPFSYRSLPLTIEEDLIEDLAARYCGGIASELEGHPVLRETRRLLLLSRGAIPSLEQAARHFWMSSRSYVRLLGKLGHSYSAIVHHFRRDFAMALLADNELSIKEIAFMLGFQNAVSLHRAFRQWTGMSIGAWSKANLGFVPPRFPV